jgi:hypothetical protein
VTHRVLILVTTLALLPRPAVAGSSVDKSAQLVKALDAMMVEFSPYSARASATVKKEYRAYLDLLVLNEYAALEDALFTGGLVPVPSQPERFNLKVRTDGPAPIAEKDLDNQATYIAARPATIGALIDIASRVKSGPLEVTSLVRHSEYQEALRTTNGNANTSVPMHTMGLAVDIALVNTPLSRVYEIRDVLRQMQEAGEILVIGERKQLVFHVVPHPSRLGHFTDVYARAITADLPGANVIAATSRAVLTELAQPVVETQVIEILPTEGHAAEWWAAEGIESDLAVHVVSSPAPVIATDERWLITRVAARAFAMVTNLFQGARDLLT